MANLTTDKNLDKHLKPIKSGEELTSLELATEGNGAKVNGDFEVTGKYDTIYLKNNSHIKSDDDINLDVTSGVDVNFRVAGVSYFNWDAELGLTMKALADSDDQVNLVVANNGQFTISTQDDSDNDLADIILDAEGDIILDSNSGKFVAKKAGAEFSAANSAYAGMILGYTDIGLNEADTTLNLTTSYIVPTAEFSVSFVAPPSGNVEIFFQVGWDAGSSNAGDCYAGLSTSGPPSYSALSAIHEVELMDGMSRGALRTIRHSWTITGLTAGASTEYWIGFKTSNTMGNPHIQWGSNATGEYPDFIMKATALPATIAT